MCKDPPRRVFELSGVLPLEVLPPPGTLEAAATPLLIVAFSSGHAAGEAAAAEE